MISRMEELPSSLYNKGQLRYRTVQWFTTKPHTNSTTEQSLEARFTAVLQTTSRSFCVCMAVGPKSIRWIMPNCCRGDFTMDSPVTRKAAK